MSTYRTSVHHRSYHERHAHEMLAALRNLRFDILQKEKHIERNPSWIYAVPLRAGRLDLLRETRSNVEGAIIELMGRNYGQVYPYLDRAQMSADAVGDGGQLSDSIAEWREKWLPNRRLNKGGRTW